MDSGNSGSLQSSSGGDEEYDSRPFLNPSSTKFTSISNPQHQPSHQLSQSHLPSTFLDPSSHNLDPFSHSPQNPNVNPIYNLDFLIKNPSYPGLVNPSSLSSSEAASLLGSEGLSQGPFPGSSSSGPLRSSSQQTDQTNVVKNPKKRTRASRRAPTTVLTTDTTNFRQMVQEFTGIPSAPFSAASPYSRRLDLFGGTSGMRSGRLDTLGPLYPLRPSFQKVQPSPYLSSSSSLSSSSTSLFNSSSAMIDSLANSTNPADVTSIGTSNNYPQQSQNMLNVQNPLFTLQSLLQSQPTFGAKNPENPRIPSLDEMVMSNDLRGYPSHENLVVSRMRDGEDTLPRWSDGGHHQEQFGSVNEKNVLNPQNVQPSKGKEKDYFRGEGTVDSWEFPSD